MNGIKEARLRAKMSRMDLADAIGVDKRTLARWETGEFEPRKSEMVRLSLVLKVPLDFIADLGNPLPPRHRKRRPGGQGVARAETAETA